MKARYILSTAILTSILCSFHPLMAGDEPNSKPVPLSPYMRELQTLESKILQSKMTEEARTKALEELEQLFRMDPFAPEANIIRNHLNFMIALPWGVLTQTKIDLKKAREILDQEHYGLNEVKKRIIEFLAVQKKLGSSKSPVICLDGPPGVGKTSIVKSIAKATGREMARVSLGGLRGEGSLRGTQRFYIGSHAGKILDAIKSAKTSNPIILLDEIDKLAQDQMMGDPSAVLLEILDPVQNSGFVDHYLGVPFDLSQVMFIATSNGRPMDRALYDRLEIIEVPAYTEAEKFNIAKNYLLPNQMKEHGLTTRDIGVTDEALRKIIQEYTVEAGVRQLERQMASLCRKALTEAGDSLFKCKVTITPEMLEKYLGKRVMHHSKVLEQDLVGHVNGLAYSQAGGATMPLEAVKVKGKGKVKMTGSLGKVMQESVKVAQSYLLANGEKYGLNPEDVKQYDIHLHAAEGAIPKDGPSAGGAVTTCLLSVLTDTPVKHDVAMTGEITLRGQITAIGGLREKLTAAVRAGVKTALIPYENLEDLKEVPEEVKKSLKIIPVKTFDEVIQHAFVRQPHAAAA